MSRGLCIGLIIALLTVLLSGIALAEYPRPGGDDGYYSAEDGRFNPQRETTCGTEGVLGLSCTPASPGERHFIPLTADINNDSLVEVITYAGGALWAYSAPTLTLIDGIDTFNFSSPELSYMQAFDYDDDGYKEVIITDKSDYTVAIYNLTGSDFYLERSFGLPADPTKSFDGECVTSCTAADNCIALCTESVDGYTVTQYRLWGTFFNSTHVSANYTALDPSGIGVLCYPFVPNIATYGAQWYPVFTGYVRGADATYQHIISMGLQWNDTHFEKIWENVDHDSYSRTGDSLACGSTAGHQHATHGGRYVSSPVILDDGTSTKLYYGLRSDTNEVRWEAIPIATGVIDQVGTSDIGNPITGLSNTVAGNFRPSSDQMDVCVIAWTNESVSIVVSCHSPGAFGDKTQEYSTGLGTLWNVSFQSRDYLSHAQASDQYTIQDYEVTLVAADNIDEITTTYGTIQPSNTGVNSLEHPWQNPKGAGAVTVSLTEEGVGYSDYIVMQESTLWYLDDNTVNEPAYIDSSDDESYTDPSYEEAWNLSTNFLIAVKVVDPDGDQVSARITLYDGTPYNRTTGWMTNRSSGSVFVVTQSAGFEVNRTIAGGTILVEARDPEYNYDSIDSEVLPLNVVDGGGAVQGDSRGVFGTDPGEPAGDEELGAACAADSECDTGYCKDGVCTELPSDEDNAVTGGVKDVADQFNFPIILMLLLIIGGMIYFAFVTPGVPAVARGAIVFMAPI
ncbi:MAG: hypothetical protein GF315_09815, partial [candidate division Zixibacteria bacterium]|nr:hypothetical protein [candidate division Zixibacteria bacterium]